MFKVKRKLIWAEIEYIHPKNIRPSDLRQPYFKDEDEDMEMILPDSPSPPARIGIIVKKLLSVCLLTHQIFYIF
jgi:hypothetical protein